jgi:hypothetical protein
MEMPVTNDLSEVIKNAPRNCWLALNDDQTEVVGHGDTPDSAIDAAIRNGVENTVLLWCPDEWIPAVY